MAPETRADHLEQRRTRQDPRLGTWYGAATQSSPSRSVRGARVVKRG
jgi:hypothetical protein